MRDDNGVVARTARSALTSGEASQRMRAQLRANVLSDQIGSERSAEYSYDLDGIRRGLTLARLGQLTRTPRERRADPEQLVQIAQGYADLADRHPPADPMRIELLAVAAAMWSLAGYQANATAIARDFGQELDRYFNNGDIGSAVSRAPYRLAKLAGAVLKRDIDQVAELGTLAQRERSELGNLLLQAMRHDAADESDLVLLAAYGLVGRVALSLSTFWRFGNPTAADSAIRDVQQAASVLLDAGIVDTWTLVDCLAHAVEDIVATSPWRHLRRATSWGPTWSRYLKALYISERPMTQVWPSQRTALDAGLLNRQAGNLAVTMPTSAGKTHIAEWAILHALGPERDTRKTQSRGLVVYIVPTRALAAQIERHLAQSLELLGMRVSSLFGGAEHVSYEAELLDFTDVLVATTEKLDLLLRHIPELAQRLRLVLVDEGHSIDGGERGLRLELLLTRIRRTAPAARIVLLSAVLPNGEDIARWLDPDAEGANHARIDWSPSQLRIGVFNWRGTEADGQRGEIDYRRTSTERFFLPSVLTRRRLTKNLFPTAPKDVAAALAIHFDRLGPVLIAAPTKAMARGAANALKQALKRDATSLYPQSDDRSEKADAIRGLREQIGHEIAEHVGADHELTKLVLHGVAYHHGEVPQAVRHCVERAYREGALRVVCATSTLFQGMNMPTKTVIVSGVHRGKTDRVSVRDFWNAAGRAGRAFMETEGHVILLATKGAWEATELRRRYLDKNNLEQVVSTLFRLYGQLLEARLGGSRPDRGQDIAALDLLDPDEQRETLALWVGELDMQMLSQLAEEVVETPDAALLEQAVGDLLAHTLGARQIGAFEWSLRPLVRFVARRAASIAHRLPDRQIRAAVIRTGLGSQGGLDALAGANQIAVALEERPELLTADFSVELRQLVLDISTQIDEVQRSARKRRVPVPAVVPTAIAWITGMPMPELHDAHAEPLGTKTVTDTASVVDGLVAMDLSWAVSAVLQLLEAIRGTPADGLLSALPAMLKYGVDNPTACYAASLGVRNRRAAIALALRCPYGDPTFSSFRDWLSELSAAEITEITGPEIAALLIRSTARLHPRTAQRVLLDEHGQFDTFLRDIDRAESARSLAALHRGTPLDLVRDPNQAGDPNVIRVEHGGELLGWIDQDIARALALVLDNPFSRDIQARLATDVNALLRQRGADQLPPEEEVLLTLRFE